MTSQDLDYDAIESGTHTDSSSDSWDSKFLSERVRERESLLSPTSPNDLNYKATVLASETESPDEEGTISEPVSSKGAWAIISLLMIGVFVSSADSTLILATYGTISSEFNAFGAGAWLTNSFGLSASAAQPIMGKLSDIYGRKSVLLVNYVFFALGCVVVGIAQSMGQAILGRVISGFGAGGMVVIVSILITDLVPLIQVASWRSYVNVVTTAGRSIGGPLGGLLADTVGWRWSFAGQGPLFLLAIILVAFRLSSPKLKPQPKGGPSKLRRIDFIGALTLSLTIVSFLGALSLGGQTLPWSHPLVLGLVGFSILLGIVFAAYETKFALEPIFPPSLVIKRDVATPYAIISLQTSAQLAMMWSIPLYFRITQSSSNTEAGSHLFPAVLGNTAGGLLTGYLIQKTGHYKSLTLLGAFSSSLTYFLLIIRWKGHTSWLESLEIIPGGFGTGIANSATFIAVTTAVEKHELAMATSGMYLASGVFMMVGIAASSAIQLGSLRGLLRRGLKGVEGRTEIIEQVISNVGSIARLEEEVKQIVVEGYVKSLEYCHMFSLGCALLALAVAFTIREHPLR